MRFRTIATIIVIISFAGAYLIALKWPDLPAKFWMKKNPVTNFWAASTMDEPTDGDRVQLTVHNQDYKEDRERFAFKMGVMWTLIVQQTNEQPMSVGQYWDVTWFRYTNSSKAK